MDGHFATLPANNSSVLCVGGITRAEAEAARQDGLDVEVNAYYLFLARQDAPAEPIQILAKFMSPLEAEHVARIFARRSANEEFGL